MPENENNNFNRNDEVKSETHKYSAFDLPRMNNDYEENKNEVENESFSSENNSMQQNKPIIEIPQAYYDKLAKEQQDKLEEMAHQEQIKAQTKEALNDSGKFLFWSVLNALVIFLLFYLTLNKFNLAILGVPAFIIILSVVGAISAKEKSTYPSTVMFGGMMVAVITFIMSMLQENKSDLWMYYTIASSVTAFLGLITSSIITTLLTNIKSVSAIKGIGYLLYFVLLIGGPWYLLNNYHEEVYKYIFRQQVVVKAETETEFILKTLKARYNVDFKCGVYSDEVTKVINYGKYKSQLDQFNRKYTERICRDSKNRDAIVQSKVYNESEVEYIVIDNYVDVLLLDESKEKIQKDIQVVANAQMATLYLYPSKNCKFYGDCPVETDALIYDTEESIKEQFRISTSLNFTNQMEMTSKDYINSQDFQYIFKIIGSYSDVSTDYQVIINNILNKLNSLGFKNTSGYEITLLAGQNSAAGETEQVVYKVKGTTNNEQTFKDPEVIDIRINK